MHIRTSHRAKLLGVVVSLAGIAAVPVAPAIAHSASAASSYKFNYTVAKSGKRPTNLLHQTGKIVGTPFGPATFTASTLVPITKYVFSFKGGKLDMTFNGTVKGVIASGPWKITGGTGKFAHAHGTGTSRGAIDGSILFHFSGTVTL